MSSRRQSETRTAKAVITLRGTARLTLNGECVRLRTKGLALLCYLAAEGPTRRERLADLLWGHAQGLRNLRVEIHRVRKALLPYGLEPFTQSGDPLALAADIAGADGEGLFCEGLDDVSPEFQDWLDQRRTRSFGAASVNYHQDLVEELAARVSAPYVVVVAGLPGSGRRALARQLAARLELPFIEGECGDVPALRYLVPSDVTSAAVADCVAADESSVWVVERSFFGEDPELVLQLRSRLPAARLRFVNLPALEWAEVRKNLPDDVKFAEGARLFVAAGGNRQYLTELLELRSQLGARDELPVPLRMRAAVALEMRSLTAAARRALEALSVHRGVFTGEALEVLGAAEHLEELERNGWLTFGGEGWTFSHELVRRLIEDQLYEGAKRRSHTALAAQLAREGAYLAAQYHRLRGSDTGAHQAKIFETLPESGGGRPRTANVVVGPELWLDEAEAEGSGVLVDGDTVRLARSAANSGESAARFRLEEETVLLRVRGRAYVEDALARDFSGPAAALSIALPGASAVNALLCDVEGPDLAIDGAVRLPIGTRFEYWLLAPAAGVLRLASRAHAALIEMKVNVFRPQTPPTSDTAGQGVVEAYVLERDLGAQEPENWPNHEAPEETHTPGVTLPQGS